METTSFVRRLGLHHFAHLRAVAEGIDVAESAMRYLGIDHGHQAKTAHQQTVDAIRAIGRRRKDKAWRLIGLTIRAVAQAQGSSTVPDLEDFIADRGLDGWSEEEVTAMYREVYPSTYRENRRRALRSRQIQYLRMLESQAAERPSVTDLVSGWFDDLTASKLVAAGILTLGEMHLRIHQGGVWYRTMPGVGEVKAARMASHLATLLPDLPKPAKVLFSIESRSAAVIDAPIVAPVSVRSGESTMPVVATANIAIGDEVQRPISRALVHSPSQDCLIKAASDFEAVEAWISARSGSDVTAKSYRREAQRLLLWLQRTRQGAGFAQMDASDCVDYQRFLEDVPDEWISRVRASPGEPGWAPFRGKLTVPSRKYALTVVSSLFAWLQSAKYIDRNPWVMVNLKVGDDKNVKLLDSKALSEAAMASFLSFLQAQEDSPSKHRIIFIFRFVEAVGLRSSELIEAKLGDFEKEPEGWFMQIHGKGSKNRIASVPKQAFAALQAYLAARGQGGIETAPPDAPLLASTSDPMAGVGYRTLYSHVKRWISKCVSASELPAKERNKLANASTHWLRHTFGTRSIARDVPLDVIQAQMGHASIHTTTATYGRAPMKRRAHELDQAFGGTVSPEGSA